MHKFSDYLPLLIPPISLELSSFSFVFRDPGRIDTFWSIRFKSLEKKVSFCWKSANFRFGFCQVVVKRPRFWFENRSQVWSRLKVKNVTKSHFQNFLSKILLKFIVSDKIKWKNASTRGSHIPKLAACTYILTFFLPFHWFRQHYHVLIGRRFPFYIMVTFAIIIVLRIIVMNLFLVFFSLLFCSQGRGGFEKVASAGCIHINMVQVFTTFLFL